MKINGMSSSPARNIAIEELLRTVASYTVANDTCSTYCPTAFFTTYINEPCIMLGRNQDPVSELSQTALNNGTPRAFRRTTGGGAVYHDSGNLNWSFVVPGTLADRNGLLQLILEALAAAGVQAAVGGRGEVTVAGRKVGGTASAAGKGVLLFHGTLLVDTDLGALRKSLAAHDEYYKPGPVRSVPSTLANLASLEPGLTVDSLAAILSGYIAGSATSNWNSLISTQLVETLTNEFSSDDWIFRSRKNELADMKGHT